PLRLTMRRTILTQGTSSGTPTRAPSPRHLDAMFENRHEAGRQLAERVAEAIGPEDAPAVVGLARGGVVVAAPVAERLGAPLDVLVVRKIGVPWQPELGVGALAEGGHRVLNERLVADIGLDAASIEEVAAREYRELERRV